MTFIRFKIHCNHSASEDVEMDIVDDDMAWVFECPKCGKQVSISNWTTDKEGEEAELAINRAITTGENCRDKYERKIKQLEEQISNYKKIAVHVQEHCCTECEDSTMCEWGCAIAELKQALNGQNFTESKKE